MTAHSTPNVAYAKSDLAKFGRTNPRAFNAMSDPTVRAMATRVFWHAFATKAEAVAALKTLPVEVQHSLSKTQAKRDAVQWGLV